MEIANAVECVQDGRIFIELIDGPLLFEHKVSTAPASGSRSSVDGSGNQRSIFRLCHSNHSRIEPPHLDRPRMAANKVTGVRTWAGGITANELFESPGGKLGGSFFKGNARPKPPAARTRLLSAHTGDA